MRFDTKTMRRSAGGYSLIELVVTLGVLAILVMGTVPMAENAVRRQKEMRLRDALRQMRAAIDEFKRDTYGACIGNSTTSTNRTQQLNVNVPTDPRTRVVIDDCTIFDTENLDRYPPSLDQLVQGVRVRARGLNVTAGSGIRDGTLQATEIDQEKEIIKIYLREIPVDPMTGEKDWKFRSTYQPADSDSWDDVNVFDVRSASTQEGLNGEKYSDW